MPELGHGAHEQQGNADKAGSQENDPSRADPVNHRSRQQAERQAREKKSEEEALRDLRTREPQGLHQRGVKNRESIKDDADGEEEI